MNLINAFGIWLYICIISSAVNYGSCDDEKNSSAKKKLQIGVKKRVDNCTVKSKKGDFLHMHYAVSRFYYYYIEKFQFEIILLVYWCDS